VVAHTGMYMLHCHMIEHEDDGMMTQFEMVGPRSSNVKVLKRAALCRNSAEAIALQTAFTKGTSWKFPGYNNAF
jgi:hypothetical protein